MKRFKKLYTNVQDIINNGYTLNSVIKFCKRKNKSCKDRCWMFLQDFLTIGKISSLSKRDLNLADYDALNEFIVPAKYFRANKSK